MCNHTRRCTPLCSSGMRNQHRVPAAACTLHSPALHLRPATTPRWSGTPGPIPTRRSLLCENNFNYTWIWGKCKRKLFVKVNGQYPSGLVNSASSPDGAPFCAGFAREKASPSGEVAERQRWPEGLCRVHSTSNLSPSISTHATASGSRMS